MVKIKDYMEQHPFDEFPLTEEEKAKRSELSASSDEVHEAERQDEEDDSWAADRDNAPSQGYNNDTPWY